jgi:Flp pilus assembly protein TadB
VVLARTRSPESRRNSSLLTERTVSGVLMIAVLAIAFVAGLVGFAIHLAWIVAIVVLALGLGYVVANSRKERVESRARRESVQTEN